MNYFKFPLISLLDGLEEISNNIVKATNNNDKDSIEYLEEVRQSYITAIDSLKANEINFNRC